MMFSKLGLWLLFPFAVLFASVIKPLFWVVKHGWDNTPFWHNVLAGYLQAKKVCLK